jgi:hypothetical protein
MKYTLLLALFPLLAYAQPDFNRNYCGFVPNDSIDLTNDGIPDVVVQGISTGSDDEPSSSGTCSLYVMNLPGTGLLSDLDGQGHRRTKVCAQGDTIAPLNTEIQNDHRVPRLAFVDGSVVVANWGYGHQSAVFTPMPNLATQRYVFQTIDKDGVWHGSFHVIPQLVPGEVRIEVGARVPALQLLIVH